MSAALIRLPCDPEWNFITALDANMALVQKLVNMTFRFHNAKVLKLSYVDYAAQKFHDGFPLGKELHIYNTSTIDKFGFGKFSGSFFDVLLRMEDGNPMNWRVFYGIEGESDEPPAPDVPKVFVLGENRPYVKKGRGTYIEYEGKQISLTEAKKIEKRLSEKP